MKLETIDQGFICKRDPDAPQPLAVGSRLAKADDGRILCSYALQSSLGINDFVPVLSESTDNGATWSPPVPIWPHIADRYSIYCSISRAPDGGLLLYGIQVPIDEPGEPFWRDDPPGMKQNDVFFSHSGDGGRSWTEPQVIPRPTLGSAEAPGPICATRKGRWLAPYAPYCSYDRSLEVDRSQIVVVSSDDRGRTWTGQSMLRFEDRESTGAEAWVIELSDGRLLGSCWNIAGDGATDLPNVYGLSLDGGDSWTPTRSTDILGQSVALAPLDDGRALFVYNQRRQDPAGVRVAVVQPTEDDFGVQSDHLAWAAEIASQAGGSDGHDEWSKFAFGEPAPLVLDDSTIIVAFWVVQPSGQGIAYVRLKME
jgi:hypothetical protein